MHAENSSTVGEQAPRTAESVYVPIIWGILVVFGIVGNGLVIYVMSRHGEKKATSYYMINLAITDLAFIIVCVPFTTTFYALSDWIFGTFMCKFVHYMIYVTLQATCLTLTAMTVDRYYAIVHPITSMHTRTRRTALLVSFVIWTASFLVSIPFVVYHDTTESYYYGPRVICTETWPSESWRNASAVYVVAVCYVLPMCVVIACYTAMLRDLWKTKANLAQRATVSVTSRNVNLRLKQRKKISFMIAIVVLLFALCWLPVHVINLWMKFDKNFPRTDVMYVIKICAHTLSYANSCVNPFVYSYAGEGFQKAVRKAFPRVFRCTPRIAPSRRKRVSNQISSCSIGSCGSPRDNTQETVTTQRSTMVLFRAGNAKRKRPSSATVICPERGNHERAGMVGTLFDFFSSSQPTSSL